MGGGGTLSTAPLLWPHRASCLQGKILTQAHVNPDLTIVGMVCRLWRMAMTRVCIWIGHDVLLAMSNATMAFSIYTRFAGECSGILISVLFMQEAVKVKPEQWQEGLIAAEYGVPLMVIFLRNIHAPTRPLQVRLFARFLWVPDH